MTCYHPLKAYRSGETLPSGKRALTFNPHKSYVEGSSFSVPCGRCIGCRLDRAYQWSARCLHEAKMHPLNSFFTLTYDDQHVPADFSVNVRDLQLFNKKLRRSQPQKIRFFACGEYGDTTLRPHYHSLYFNHRPSDLKLYAYNKQNDPIYTSQTINQIWQKGTVFIGNVTAQSAGYVARYSLKKINGDRADDHYTRRSPIDGNIYRVKSEFLVMSRRPGIGATWFDKFSGDCFPSDFIVIDGQRRPIPRYYALKLEEETLRKLKIKRKLKSHKKRADQTPARLKVREEVLASRVKRLNRG